MRRMVDIILAIRMLAVDIAREMTTSSKQSKDGDGEASDNATTLQISLKGLGISTDPVL